MGSYTSKLEQFDKRTAAINMRLSEISMARQEQAIRATDDDAAALKVVERLDNESSNLQRELELISAATAQIKDLQAKEAEAESLRDKADREANAVRIINSVLKIDNEYDATQNTARSLLAARDNLLSELDRLKVKPSPMIQRLRGKSGPSAACMKAGLGRYVALEFISAPQTCTLSEYDAVLKPRTTKQTTEREAAA